MAGFGDDVAEDTSGDLELLNLELEEVGDLGDLADLGVETVVLAGVDPGLFTGVVVMGVELVVLVLRTLGIGVFDVDFELVAAVVFLEGGEFADFDEDEDEEEEVVVVVAEAEVSS